MKRKEFIRKGLLGTGIFITGTASANSLNNAIDELKPLDPMEGPDNLGFNHIPNTESTITHGKVLHKAHTRGHADHGWLNTHHTFSFANYHNPERMHFGVLRVLNDDIVQQGMGFRTHPHDNMEIISIPLEGDLEHKDSMGNVSVIRHGDVQVMTAGTGIQHSEFNKNQDRPVKFLQIWVFPNQRGLIPRYDQISMKLTDRRNKLQQILSPTPEDAGVWIHQNAWFHLGRFDKGIAVDYKLKKQGNGVYAFVINGDLTIDGTPLHHRDGLGLWDISIFNIRADSQDAEVLLMEVPMTL